MAFVTDFDTLHLVWALSLGLIALSGLMMLFIVGRRLWLYYAEREEQKLLLIWQPILYSSLTDAPRFLPRIGRFQLFAFLVLWNYMHESLRGEIKEKLNETAHLAGIAAPSYKLLEHRNLRHRLLGIITFGNLNDTISNSEALVDLANNKDPIISLFAVRSLFRINQTEAIRRFLPLITTRKDWAPPYVAWMLRELGADLLSEPLIKLIDEYSRRADFDPTHFARIIRYLDAAHVQDTRGILARFLREFDDKEIIISCLRMVKEDDDLDTVRKLVLHDSWEVRMHAVIALGKFGTEQDENRLIRALSDLEWWVRYRAAAALLDLPNVNREKLRSVLANHYNPFARDMLRQVMAETNFAL